MSQNNPSTSQAEGTTDEMTQTIASDLIALYNQGKHQEVVEKYYSPVITSIEGPGTGTEARLEGLEAVQKKGEWWRDNHEVHSSVAKGLFIGSEGRFAVQFDIDVTQKPTGNRIQMSEVGVYTVIDGKIIKEEFLYASQ